MNILDNEMAELKKKGYKGKTWKKETMCNLIAEKEEAFRNCKKTAIEEKAMMEEIRKMKASLKHVPLMDKNRKKFNEIRKLLNQKRDEMKPVFKLIDGYKAGLKM